MILHLLHDCTLAGRIVRHREGIDFTEVKLNSGHLRLEGTRCDGSAIEAYGNRGGSRRSGRSLVAYSENADSNDPDRYERVMWEAGQEWISRDYGPWEPLIDLPEQVPDGEQPSLLDALAEEGLA